MALKEIKIRIRLSFKATESTFIKKTRDKTMSEKMLIPINLYPKCTI